MRYQIHCITTEKRDFSCAQKTQKIESPSKKKYHYPSAFPSILLATTMGMRLSAHTSHLISREVQDPLGLPWLLNPINPRTPNPHNPSWGEQPPTLLHKQSEGDVQQW